jgi:hypothetical protein
MQDPEHTVTGNSLTIHRHVIIYRPMIGATPVGNIAPGPGEAIACRPPIHGSDLVGVVEYAY